MGLRARITERAFPSLVDLVYQNTEDDSGWVPLLHALAEVLGGRVTAFLSHDLSGAGAIVVNVRADPEATRLYNEQWCHHDPWALSPRARTLVEPGRVLIDDMLVSYQDVQKTDYFRGFARPFQISRLLCVPLSAESTRLNFLSVTRAHEHEPFGEVEAQLVGALVPHIHRATRLRHTLEQARLAAGEARAGLDAVAIGILFVDGHGRIRHANATALRLLAARDGLYEDREGLRAGSSKVTAILRRLCAECVAHQRVRASAQVAPWFCPSLIAAKPAGVGVSTTHTRAVRPCRPRRNGRRVRV